MKRWNGIGYAPGYGITCSIHNEVAPCLGCRKEEEIFLRVDCDTHGLSSSMTLGENNSEFCIECVSSLLDKHLPRLKTIKVKGKDLPSYDRENLTKEQK